MSGRTWFTADTHFGHPRILDYCPASRPFASVGEMDEALVAAWNATVAPQDTVWHLGDFAMGDPGIYLPRLNGEKHLVSGNHDGPATLSCPGWASVQPYAATVVGSHKVVLFHYGLRMWERMRKGSLMLYGHSHGSLPGCRTASGGGTLDVGVDCWNLRPVGLKDVYRRLRTLPLMPEPEAEDG